MYIKIWTNCQKKHYKNKIEHSMQVQLKKNQRRNYSDLIAVIRYCFDQWATMSYYELNSRGLGRIH